MIRNFKQILEKARDKGRRRLAVPAPRSRRVFQLLKEAEKIGLIILDSAALFYRLGLTQDDSSEENMANRRELVNQIGILHGIARKYGVAVVITNQVYKDVATGELCPVGGNAFEHLSKTIILLDKIGTSKRKATLRKHRSKSEGIYCEFRLTEKGAE